MRTISLILRLTAILVTFSSLHGAGDTTPKQPTSVTVEGAVNRPGVVEFPQDRGLTIVEAISLAGGPARLADLKRVWLIRQSGSGAPVKTVIDVDALMKRRAADVPSVRAGDRIVVIGRDVDDDGF